MYACLVWPDYMASHTCLPAMSHSSFPTTYPWHLLDNDAGSSKRLTLSVLVHETEKVKSSPPLPAMLLETHLEDAQVRG
jgi:hypothetical protein